MSREKKRTKKIAAKGIAAKGVAAKEIPIKKSPIREIPIKGALTKGILIRETLSRGIPTEKIPAKKIPIRETLGKVKEGLQQFGRYSDSLEEKMFRKTAVLANAAGCLLILRAGLTGLGKPSAVCGVACALSPFMLEPGYRRRGRDFRWYYRALCLFLNLVIVPLQLFLGGGLNSAVPLYCLGAFLLCAFCTEGKDRREAAAAALANDLFLFALLRRWPLLAVPLNSDFLETDLAAGFTFVAAASLLLISEYLDASEKQRSRFLSTGIIESMGAIIEARSAETGSHVVRIRTFMEILLDCANREIPEAEFSRAEIRRIASAATLHDIGKIAVPDSILNKPGRLTEKELEAIRRHPLDGCRMIETMREYQNTEYYRYCYEICRHHHERYDGSGYPDGLRGEEIPLISQLAGVADIYEALTSERVYKKAYSPEAAAEIILKKSPGQFSEPVLRTFAAARPRLDRMITAGKRRKRKSSSAA